MENEEPPIPSRLSQPIFWVALLIIFFNVLLFLWSMTRDGGDEESPVDIKQPLVEE